MAPDINDTQPPLPVAGFDIGCVLDDELVCVNKCTCGAQFKDTEFTLSIWTTLSRVRAVAVSSTSGWG